MSNTGIKYLNEVQYIQPKMPMSMKNDAPDILRDMLGGCYRLSKKERKIFDELVSILEEATPELIF